MPTGDTVIGLIGGLGIGASIHYYRELAAAHEADEIAAIDQTYRQMARSGYGSPAQRDALTALAMTLCARGRLDAVLLAGTDLSLVFDDTTTAFPHLDCAAAHIRAIMRAYRR